MVQAPARAQRGCDVVRDDVLGVAVEGADEGQAPSQGVPADDRGDRLVDVGHVEAARAQLAAQRRDRDGVPTRFETAPLHG
jgi:hypothetical protein